MFRLDVNYGGSSGYGRQYMWIFISFPFALWSYWSPSEVFYLVCGALGMSKTVSMLQSRYLEILILHVLWSVGHHQVAILSFPHCHLVLAIPSMLQQHHYMVSPTWDCLLNLLTNMNCGSWKSWWEAPSKRFRVCMMKRGHLFSMQTRSTSQYWCVASDVVFFISHIYLCIN